MTGLAIATMMLSLYVGKSQITPDKYGVFLAAVKTSFMVFSALCFLGIFASLAKKKANSPEPKAQG